MPGRARVSGDGFVTAADGHPRWGRYGAAGILLRHAAGAADDSDSGAGNDTNEPWFFLARRSEHCHRGGTWAIPGGALDLHEDALTGARREFAEEIGIDLGTIDHTVAAIHEDDHGGWSYWTVIVDVAIRFDPPPISSWETAEVRWVRATHLDQLEGGVFDAFLATLHRLGLVVPIP